MKYRKRIIACLLCLLLLSGMSGCSLPLPLIQQNSARATVDKVIDALSNNDADELLSLFSSQAISEAVDIDEGVQHIMSLFEGDVETVDFGASDNEVHRGDPGDRTTLLQTKFIVTTSTEVYLFFTVEYTESTLDPELLGLYQLQIVREEDIDTEFFWGSNFGAGIYLPTNDE